jgi:hypothetical protein
MKIKTIKRRRQRYNKRKSRRGGSLREMASAKFLVTRIINPANPDRLLYKNAFFLEFIDESMIENRIYTNEPIKIVEQCDKYYIYTKEYLGASQSKPAAPPQAITNTPQDKLDVAEDKSEKQTEDIESFVEDKPRACFSVSDTINRKSFSKLNDAPLVDRELLVFPEYNSCISFAQEFDPLYKILHIYKYQIGRVLWTPSEMIYFTRISYLLKKIYETINNNAQLKPYVAKELTTTLLIASLKGSVDKVYGQAVSFAFKGDNTTSDSLQGDIATETKENEQPVQQGGGIGEININSILLKFFDIDPVYLNTNSLKYIMPLKKKFPPFMLREAVNAVKIAKSLLLSTKGNPNIFLNKFTNVDSAYENANNLRKNYTKNSDDLKDEIKNLNEQLRQEIKELNDLNPGKSVGGGVTRRRHKKRRYGKTRKNLRGGGMFDSFFGSKKSAPITSTSTAPVTPSLNRSFSATFSPMTSQLGQNANTSSFRQPPVQQPPVQQPAAQTFRDRLASSAISAASGVSAAANRAASGVSAAANRAASGVSQYASMSKDYVIKQKNFFDAVQDIFQKCYESMVDYYLVECSKSTNNTSSMIKGKSMKEHVAKFFLVLHECTFTKLIGMFTNTILFNTINFYNPLATLGPVLFKFPALGPVQPFEVAAGAALLLPTIHVLCAMRLMASELKNSSILISPNDFERFKLASNPPYATIQPDGSFAPKVPVSQIVGGDGKMYYIETDEFSFYGNILEIDKTNPSNCKLKVKYLYQGDKPNENPEDIPKLVDKLKPESKLREALITPNTNIQLVYKFENDTNESDFNKFFDNTTNKYEGNYAVFVNNLKERLDYLKGKQVSLNDSYLGYVVNVTYQNTFMGAGGNVKSVNLQICSGNPSIPGNSQYQITLPIKFNEIGPKGSAGKKYFQIVKIVGYSPTLTNILS